MQRLAAFLVVLAGVAVLPASVHAQPEDEALPVGRIGVNLGVRQGLGRLGNDFGVGMVGGIEAGYHPTRLDQRLSLGAFWAVRRSWFGDDEASIAGSLDLIELDFGARLRLAQQLGVPRFLVLGAGASVLRTNVPLPPDDRRNYVGPYASLGFEFFVGKVLLGVDARYGLIALGPGSLSWTLSASLGQ